MKTWLKWIGDKHQQFSDWANAEDIAIWKSIIRIIIFCLVDGLLIAAATITLVILFFMIFGKLFDNEDIPEEE